MTIAIDFDGTCVTNDFPAIGKDIGAVPVLQELVRKNHKLILLTMRSGKTLEEAVAWFEANDIRLYAVNRNPVQWKFSDSPKVYADLYIDDMALGCPLKADKQVSHKAFVDWEKVYVLLLQKYVL